MSGELDETQLVSSLLPRGRGNRSEGTEWEVDSAESVAGVVRAAPGREAADAAESLSP